MNSKMIFVSLFFLIGVFAQDFSNDYTKTIASLKTKNSYDAQVPLSICKEKFPFYKVLKQDLNSTTSFNLFTFTAVKFNSTKPSILVVNGGPGGISSFSDAGQLSKLFLDYNVIFFHIRGGGCSFFPSNDTSLDKYISSSGAIIDLEMIRKSYGIPKWKSVLGFSYGTDVARRYANKFGDRIQTLVLEGLSSDLKVDTDLEVKLLLKTIRDRFSISETFKGKVSTEVPKLLEENLINLFTQVPLRKSFEYVALWPFYENFYSEYFKKAGNEIPRIIRRSTFSALTILMYTGDSIGSDIAILVLLNNLGIYSFDDKTMAPYLKSIEIFERSMFPFHFDDYLTTLDSTQILSWRVLLAMPENDKIETESSLCSNVETIVINGTKDLATPVENVERYLANKSCAKAPNRSLIVNGGGHSSMTSMKCLSNYVKGALENKTLEKMDSCELPVSIKIY